MECNKLIYTRSRSACRVTTKTYYFWLAACRVKFIYIRTHFFFVLGKFTLSNDGANLFLLKRVKKKHPFFSNGWFFRKCTSALCSCLHSYFVFRCFFFVLHSSVYIYSTFCQGWNTQWLSMCVSMQIIILGAVSSVRLFLRGLSTRANLSALLLEHVKNESKYSTVRFYLIFSFSPCLSVVSNHICFSFVSRQYYFFLLPGLLV